MQPRIHQADEGRVLDILGIPLVEKAGSDDLNGGAAVYVQTVMPAGGPPAHIHHDTDEFFYVLSGELDVWVDRRHVRLETGMSATLPRGVVHEFKNRGKVPAKVLTVVTPGKGGRFFDDIDEARPRLPADIDKLGAIVARHDIRFVG
jgi:mannose-6-phosphate isomerase-like protein (cupin superfamily)